MHRLLVQARLAGDKSHVKLGVYFEADVDLLRSILTVQQPAAPTPAGGFSFGTYSPAVPPAQHPAAGGREQPVQIPWVAPAAAGRGLGFPPPTAIIGSGPSRNGSLQSLYAAVGVDLGLTRPSALQKTMPYGPTMFDLCSGPRGFEQFLRFDASPPPGPRGALAAGALEAVGDPTVGAMAVQALMAGAPGAEAPAAGAAIAGDLAAGTARAPTIREILAPVFDSEILSLKLTITSVC